MPIDHTNAHLWLPLVQAMKDGKKVELFWNPNGLAPGWYAVRELTSSNSPDNYHIVSIPTLRPWRPEEVPVGAVVRRIGATFKWVLGATDQYSDMLVKTDLEWKWPHEPDTAWRPCGVEE